MARQRLHVVCNGSIVTGCKNEHYARGVCQSCYMKGRREGLIVIKRDYPMPTPRAAPRVTRIDPVSLCCGAPCAEGEPHDFGKLYCKTCLLPCYWIATSFEKII